MEPLPVAGWPNIFRLAFQLVYEASWRLRDHDNYISVWVPSPSDLGDIEYKLVIPNHDDINVIRKSNPALLNIAFVGAAPAVSDSADIGTVESTEWFGKCRILAEQYLTLGDTREALFWLNVGVESLLHERMLLMIQREGLTITEEDLKGAPSYWDAAKSLVAEQCPELAKSIIWPQSTPTVPSVFRRVKFLGKHVRLEKTIKEILAHYSKVQHDRNSLFHGESETPIVAHDVKVAIDSFDWLVINFTLSQNDKA